MSGEVGGSSSVPTLSWQTELPTPRAPISVVLGLDSAEFSMPWDR